MTSLDWSDTIVAPATPPGIGARSILRLTGPDAHSAVCSLLVADSLAPLPWLRRFVRPVHVRWDDSGRSIGALLHAWPTGKSSTGQALAELHLEATGIVTDMVERSLLNAGVRKARPGEFTLRSFLAGRLDLAQAEGVLGLIEAEDQQRLRAAIDQRSGGLSLPIASLRDDLLDLLADLEAGLDFVEEDITFVSDEEALARLDQAQAKLAELQSRWRDRAVASAAPRVVLVGPANAGKSSLFNALLGRDRAIVSDQAGTTRDWIQAKWNVGDREVELVDTAGYEFTHHPFIAPSAQQRERAIEQADLLLVCVPAKEDSTPAAVPVGIDQLILWTKCDVGNWDHKPAAAIPVSIHEPARWEELRRRVSECLDRKSRGEEPGGINVRVIASLHDGRSDLERAADLLRAGAGHEIVAAALHDALHHLGEIVGAVYTDDLLDRVFSRFCIGK